MIHLFLSGTSGGGGEVGYSPENQRNNLIRRGAEVRRCRRGSDGVFQPPPGYGFGYGYGVWGMAMESNSGGRISELEAGVIFGMRGGEG